MPGIFQESDLGDLYWMEQLEIQIKDSFSEPPIIVSTCSALVCYWIDPISVCGRAGDQNVSLFGTKIFFARSSLP